MDFENIWPIFEEAFTSEFRRSREGQAALLKNPKYHLHIYGQQEDSPAGFMGCWHFDDFIFVEHFAVDKNLRGKGMGAKMMKDLLSEGKLVILEVEEPDTEINRRRIGFYERAGLMFHDFPYFQPSFIRGEKPVPLKIMASRLLSAEEFCKYREKLFEEVYGMNKEERHAYFQQYGMQQSGC